VISRYQAAKDRRGLLDYDDLIDKALALLRNAGAAWVHYKLDQGIDHVLIDEAQDTSPKQWEIIRLLTGEFFAGAGARPDARTVFAVGDEKQSIFSFQGAAPREFDRMRRDFAALCTGARRLFRFVPLRHSFRSGANLLGAFDTVFGRPAAYSGLSADAVATVHEPLPGAPPGEVEIWETVKPLPKREIEAWAAPFDELTERSPQLRLAARIAASAGRWIVEGARAGDVLVLVRQRGALFEAIIRALKEANIEVAGADRLVLTEHIAVMDLMALVDALLLPEDDLALATVLKSPLLGLDDQDLLEVAWERKSSLRAALRAKAPLAPRFAEAASRLDRLAGWAAQEGPFNFLARVLDAEGGRRRFLSRLGHEANDPLDELLNLALAYEERETPSLQGFVAWLRTAQTDVKRDMEIARDEVRVMTVHGAKGLEAPIVVLADTTTPPAGPVQRQPRLLELAMDGAAPPLFAWASPKAADVAATAAARQRALLESEAEHHRLLYVAMTRAIDRLVVCGAEGERKPAEGCWWKLIWAALHPLSTEEEARDGSGKLWRYRPLPPPAGRAVCAAAPARPARCEPPPAWLAGNAPSEAVTAPPLSPSRAYDETVVPRRAAAAESRADREKAMARGVAMHRLLQSLPDIPAPARREAARRHLARAAPAFDGEERERMIAQVERILEEPRFAALFLPGSRAEVPIAGRLSYRGAPVTVSGQLDRLAVTADSVLIADYKTNRPPVRSLAAVPKAYVAQLALYRAVLQELYPAKSIRAALIWTEVPELMEVPAAVLDAALAVTSP
jgi:ATP-dependent helicase/nuclease subunit A